MSGKQVSQYSYICTNPKCTEGLAHWKGFGEASKRKCYLCGGPLRRIQGEPRGTSHAR